MAARGIERLHRLALGGRAAARARHMLPAGVMDERIARFVERDILGQGDGQLLVGHRHGPARFTMDNRNRAAPVTLTANAPIAQAVIDGAVAHPAPLQLGKGGFFGFGGGKAVEGKVVSRES